MRKKETVRERIEKRERERKRKETNAEKREPHLTISFQNPRSASNLRQDTSKRDQYPNSVRIIAYSNRGHILREGFLCESNDPLECHALLIFRKMNSLPPFKCDPLQELTIK